MSRDHGIYWKLIGYGKCLLYGRLIEQQIHLELEGSMELHGPDGRCPHGRLRTSVNIRLNSGYFRHYVCQTSLSLNLFLLTACNLTYFEIDNEGNASCVATVR